MLHNASIRCDLTFLDFEAGTTAAARKAAAQQIGEIAKHHPYDLQNLLERVRFATNQDFPLLTFVSPTRRISFYVTRTGILELLQDRL